MKVKYLRNILDNFEDNNDNNLIIFFKQQKNNLIVYSVDELKR